MNNIRLKDFFGLYDESGHFHDGFLQSINLNDYVDITILNEITMSLMDSFIKNEIGNIKTMGNWNCFLEWDKDEKKYKINSEFYYSAKLSMYGYLTRSQRFYELLNTNFSSLSATETEQIIYGQKEEQKDYDKVIVNIERDDDTKIFGQEQRTLLFGNTEKSIAYGNTQRTLNFGAKHSSNVFGNTSETFTNGSQTNTSGTTNQTRPFDMNTFLDDTANNTTATNGQRQDTKTALSHTDTMDENARIDSETNAQHSDTETETSHTDTETNAQHTDTNSYGDITNTTDNRQDKTTIKTHTDTKTRTKVILIKPDKYFEIMKELYSHNVYDILLNAVKDCFTIRAF